MFIYKFIRLPLTLMVTVVWVRCAVFTVMLFLFVDPLLMAQTPSDFGTGGATSETTLMVSKMYKTYKQLALAVAAVCAIVGGIKVYGKMMEGGSDSRRGILAWFSASIFSLLVMEILDALFR